MRYSVVAVVASLAQAASGLLVPQEDAVLFRRARDRSPESLMCHKTCGNTIIGASKEGYCKDQAWEQLQARCDECAPKYDNIAEQYHGDLEQALSPCGLQAPPVSGQPSGSASSSTAASSSSVAAPSSAASPSSAVGSSSAAAQPTSSVGTASSAVSQPTSSAQESSTDELVPTASGPVSSTPEATVSATSVSSAEASRSNNATATASPSRVASDAQSARAGPLVTVLAVLLAAAMLH